MHNPIQPREKTFGPGPCIPLDGNAKARIKAFAQGYNATHRQDGQHRGPITRAFFEVFEALLWGFHNSQSGRCFPSYERIAEKAKCCRDTVYEAIKVLEKARVLTWVNRITHKTWRERDIFGKWQIHRQVIRTSNAYVFRDPGCKSENPGGTLNQENQILTSIPATPVALPSAVSGALDLLEAAIKAKCAHEGCS